jgi:hypothetical protein
MAYLARALSFSVVRSRSSRQVGACADLSDSGRNIQDFHTPIANAVGHLLGLGVAHAELGQACGIDFRSFKSHRICDRMPNPFEIWRPLIRGVDQLNLADLPRI